MTPSRCMHSAATNAAARLILTIVFACIATTGIARADVTNLDAANAPIVRINVRQGDVTIRTWDRPSVAVDGDPSLVIDRRSTSQTGQPFSLPITQAEVRTGDGPVSLPAENFVLSTVPAGPRELILVRNAPLEAGANAANAAPTPVTVTVPNSSVFVFAHTNNGTVDVRDYRGGTLFATAYRGRVSLENVGGTVFAQSVHGPVTVSDSTFDRLRARSLLGNVTFERCRARQVEATSVNGSVVYDGGTFEPGLARFESTRGDVAIGTNGAAEIAAHTAGSGRVFTNFEHGAHIGGHEGETSAVVAGGGPVVNATSQGGNVYLYDGSLRVRGASLSNDWQAPVAALERPLDRASSHPFVPARGAFPAPGASGGASASPRPGRRPNAARPGARRGAFHPGPG